jgi:hypothetical protein
VEIVVAGGAGDGFVRRVRGRGAEALLTGDSDPASALARIVAGELRRIAATRTCV